jgi:DNA-binding CsgD family transcriptional regulator
MSRARLQPGGPVGRQSPPRPWHDQPPATEFEAVGGRLGRLLDRIGRAKSGAGAACHLMDELPDLVGADIIGVYFHQNESQLMDIFVRGVRQSVLDHYEQFGRSVDFVLQAAVRSLLPVHQGGLLAARQWHEHHLYREVARKFPLEHYLLAPIHSCGKVLGTINLGRRKGCHAFSTDDLLRMSTIAAHVATKINIANQSKANHPSSLGLTSRQREVACLVAEGYSNFQIGLHLRISENGVKQALKRIFAKARINTRAELAAAEHLRVF